ncbi:prepilin peptidase [Rhizobium sp. TH2]|uniref:A24 family peptidase n=1 Tax=Rhizobium sp. TH2 TaxID=2775403 RepID=UPI002157D7A3|nr:prepilin peptidase [Rhizobium sp. TH2]UVC08697.1 prepilin peptidase [Rhizobium sp. TH2]
MVTAAILVIFPLCMAMAACSDLLTMTIPNRLSVILIASFLAVAPFAGLSLQDMLMHLAGGGIVFAACFALFAFGIMGGGDAKILAASALWFGFDQSLLVYIIYVSVFGGLLSLAIISMRSQHDMIMTYGIPVPRTMMHAKKVPYGIAIGAAAFIAYPSSPLVLSALGIAQS